MKILVKSFVEILKEDKLESYSKADDKVLVWPILEYHHINSVTTNPSWGELYANSYLTTSALKKPDMISSQKELRYPYK